MRDGPNGAGPVAQGDHEPRSTPASAGSAPTTSTSTRSTAGIIARRSRRRWRRCTTWSRRARPATSARRRCTRGSSARRCTPPTRHGWTRFVSMQDHYNLLNREEEREMLPLCADQGIGVIPWSPLARGRLTRDWDEATERSETDEFGQSLYDTPTSDRVIVERVGRSRRRARRAARAGGAGVDARQAGRHVADRRRHEARSTSTTRWPRSSSSSPPTRSPASRSRTSPTTIVGFA